MPHSTSIKPRTLIYITKWVYRKNSLIYPERNPFTVQGGVSTVIMLLPLQNKSP